MLVLSRKADGEIVIGDNVVLKVISIRGDVVRLGIEAPKDMPVHRREVRDRIEAERESQDTDDAGKE